MFEDTNDFHSHFQVLEKLREMSADEKMKELARRRELVLHDRITDIEVSREEGRQEGLQQGLQKGRQEGIDAIVEKMCNSGMSEEQIQAILDK
ncbi:MAG: hypothetical protein PUB66_06045 [Oscillospiraceae bacterium]|nr:hypothetical protein [Oscillospiraceae bacterium]